VSELDNEDSVDRLQEGLGPPADPEAPAADAIEQRIDVVRSQPPDERALDPEASEADIIEQRQAVESEEDDYGPG
jgi:hypothetical protein